MERNQNAVSALTTCIAIALIICCLGVWWFVKGWSEMLGLNWSATALLMSGTALIVTGVGALLWYEWHPAGIVYSLPIVYPIFFRPALNYWARLEAYPFAARMDMMESVEPAWYGTIWFHWGIWLALVAAAYAVHVHLRDRY